MISRFAPAPTGFLHLGHVVNAVCVWRETRARGGRVLLRIEDHDQQRSRREYEAEILDDLAWLGFAADEPLVRQSERGEIYERALDGLRRQGLVYACNCSRAAITRAGLKARASGNRDETDPAAQPFGAADSELWYPGTCRERRLPEEPGLGVRVRLEPSTERFDDLRHGPQEQQPYEQCGDLLVKDRDGNWTYQFAATVDDYVQGVTLVIRGDDLLASTGRQLQLARLLGRREPPQFLHHALIMKSPRQKLSKSDSDSGIRELRALGWTPAQVRDHAMSRVGRFPYDLQS
ncbi:MAG TPA: glutamate--tRNA ligase family protein [Vicinamibacterales bacterium]|nr:glutamate--tRNA ligase family protein [Vicinamibacterales bacterium]